MKDKETKLIEKLIDDKTFLMKFSENRSLEEQLQFLKENGFNFSEEEFKDFIKSLEEAYVSSENMSEEDLENVSGGKMEMRSKIAAVALVFSALGAGSMMGQVSAGWSDWLPHNLIISAYNGMFSSSDGDGQGNAAATSAQSETSQRSRSTPPAMSERSSQRRKLEQTSSNQRSNSAQRDQSKTSEKSATSANTRQRRSNSDPDTRTSVAQPSAASSAQQSIKDQYIERFKKVKDNDEALIKFVKEIEEEYESLNTASKMEMSAEERKGLGEKIAVIKHLQIGQDYQIAKRGLENSKQSAASSSAPGVTRADAKTPDSKTFTQAGQVSSQPYSSYGNAQLVTGASSQATQAPAVPDRIVALSVSTEDADETLRGLKERLEWLEKEIASYGSGSPNLEKDEELSDDEKGAIQAEYVARLEHLEKEHKETKELIEKMEKEREKQSKKESKRQTEEGQRPVSTTSAAAEAAAPVTVTIDQSELRAAEIAVAELLSLKSEILRLNAQKTGNKTTYELLKKLKDSQAETIEKQMKEDDRLIQEAEKKIREIKSNLEAAGQLDLVKSMEAQHKGITNIGQSCYLNTALQVLSHEFAKDEKGRDLKTAILQDFEKAPADKKGKCPTLNGLYTFFKALQDGNGVIEYEKMLEVVEFFNQKEGFSSIYDGEQQDTSEILYAIIDRSLVESKAAFGEDGSLTKTLNELYVFGYLEPDDLNVEIYPNDSKEVIAKRVEEKKKNLLKLEDGRFVNKAAARVLYPSIPVPESKLFEDLTFDEVFDRSLVVTGSSSKNMIIRLPRKHYETKFIQGQEQPVIEQVKLKNRVEILPEFTTNDGVSYRLKAISMHMGTDRSGHYYAYVRSSINPDVWLCYNDMSVSQRFGPIIEDPEVKCHQEGEEITDTRSLIEDPYVQQNATNLVYELVE